MLYLITFLEGLITFISPCLLPMLPAYLSYFAGGKSGQRQVLKGALGFVLGFTVVFVMLGAFAATAGMILRRYQTVLNLVTGGVVVLFGLSYLGVFHIKLFRGFNSGGKGAGGFLQSMLFGMVFSIGWTPCVGAFLGSALMLASQQGSMIKGIWLLLLYSMGLGIPFVASAVLIDRLKGAFDWIKRHYRQITVGSGSLLVLMGVLMMTGVLGNFLALLSV